MKIDDVAFRMLMYVHILNSLFQYLIIGSGGLSEIYTN